MSIKNKESFQRCAIRAQKDIVELENISLEFKNSIQYISCKRGCLNNVQNQVNSSEDQVETNIFQNIKRDNED
jgi:hypothetical protein